MQKPSNDDFFVYIIYVINKIQNMRPYSSNVENLRICSFSV